MNAPRWEYLTLHVSLRFNGWGHPDTAWQWTLSPARHVETYEEDLDRIREAMQPVGAPVSDNSRGSNPVLFFDEVLGPDGWEIVSIQDRRRLQFAEWKKPNAEAAESSRYLSGNLVAYRIWCKRPLSDDA